MINQSIKKLCILFLVVSTGCAIAEPEYIQSDKIYLYFGEENNNKEIVAENSDVFPLYIEMDIDNISFIEIFDVSQENQTCTDDILKSPSKIASFSLDQKSNIKNISFRIRLPCATYHNEFYIMIKVKSLTGNFYLRQKLPVLITREGPGYFIDGHEYSGVLPRKTKLVK